MFIEKLEDELNVTETTNGAKAYKTTKNNIIDLFAQLGAMRGRCFRDKIELFKNAFYEDKELAMKILFYYRDCREGQGERQTFRDIYLWLTQNAQDIAIDNIKNIIEFGRWDDLIDIAYESRIYCYKQFAAEVLCRIENTIKHDVKGNDNITLLGKWLPSINASSKNTRDKAKWLCYKLEYTEREYRKICSELRAKIRIVENNLRTKEYDKIDYSKVPSLAIKKYREAFVRNDYEHYSKYLLDVMQGKSKINTKTLFPYDIVREYLINGYNENDTLELQWKNLPDYVQGKDISSLTVCDVSGSMTDNRYLPLATAISLSVYIAEKTKGAYANKFITFSERPQLVNLKRNMSLYEKIQFMNQQDWEFSTNLYNVFKLVLDVAVKNNLKQEDLPKQIIVITDMNFDCCNDDKEDVLMEKINNMFNSKGYNLPTLVWWNVNAINEVFPMKEGNGVKYVSGASPVILKSVLNEELLSPMDLIKNTVLTERYSEIKF